MSERKLTTAKIAVLVAIATFGSNLLGFVREMVLANYFGAGMVSDAYVMGSSIPTTLLAAVISAMGTAYMPILAMRFEGSGVKAANKFTSQMTNMLLIVVAAFFALSFIFSSQMISIFAPGFSGEKETLTIYYMRVAFIALMFTALMTFIDAYLRYRGSFVAQEVIAYIQNIVVIIAILLAAKGDVRIMVWGLVIGTGLRTIGVLIAAKRKGFDYQPSFQFSDSVKEVFALAIPVFIGGSFSEINTFIDKMLASTLPEGSVTSLSYSGKLISLILTFSVGIFTTIIYPKLTQAFAQRDFDRISNIAERGINLFALLTIPFALGAIVYAVPLTRIVYERGAFDSVATRFVSISFLFYAIRVPFYAVSDLLNKAFYSMHNTMITVYCSIIAVAVNVGLNFILVKPMGVGGLALATSIAEIAGMAIRYILFRKKYKEITLLRSAKKLVLIAMFSVIAVAISYFVYTLLAGISILLIRVMISVLAAVAIYLAMLYIAKFEELKLIRDLV